MVEMVFVDSSNIESIGYEDGELHIQFTSGGYYVYHGVPRHVYDDLMNASSKGSFLNREIKNVYQFTKQ
jgi:hypothetical protein